MALKALMLRKQIDSKKKALNELLAKEDDFKKREDELTQAIEEATTDEETKAVEDEVEKFEGEKKEHEDAKSELEDSIKGLEDELKDAETEKPDERQEAEKMEVRDAATFDVAKKALGQMNEAEQRAMFDREDVKGWIGEIRAHIKEKRELTNVGLTIPEVFLGYLRENVEKYSKLYKHVTVQRISGTGREIVMGSVPEAIWTECCGALNELSLNFNDVTVNCFKVGGYFKICNAILEDSDLNLASLLLDAIGQAIGYALDKAILYGRNADVNMNMPEGIVSRLVQTSKPSGYPATARPWVDLHISNVVMIPNSATGVALFQAITTNAGAIKGKYARGEKTWVMNEATYTFLKVQAMSINAAGAIVSSMENTMPVIGGAVETLEFIPDYVIIGGYFELYTLAERAGQKFAQSEHAFFLNDQTAFKGTARYDGIPVIAEGFAAIGVNGTTPTASMTFAPDDANDCDLAGIDGLTLSPTFAAGTTTYTATTNSTSNTVTAIAVNKDASILVTYNGDQVLNGAAIKWAAGDGNVVVITVKKGNSSKAYTITVTKGSQG